MAKKRWTRCSHDVTGEVWVTLNLRQFALAHDLSPQDCYKVRKPGTNERSIKKWRFAFVDDPGDAAVWAPVERVGIAEVESKRVKEAVGADFKLDMPAVLANDAIFGDEIDEDVESLPAVPFDQVFKSRVDGKVPIEDDEDDGVDEYADVRDIVGDGSRSPLERYRYLADLIMRLGIDIAEGNGSGLEGAKLRDLTTVLDSFGKAHNIDPKTAKDTRTVAEQIMEGISSLLIDPNRIWEKPDKVILGIEHQMMKITDLGNEFYDKFNGSGLRAGDILGKADLLLVDADCGEDDPPSPKVMAAAATKWVERCRRVRKLAQWAKEPYFCSDKKIDRRERIVWCGTHLLRYMLYVGRPDLPDADILHYIFADFHIETTMKLWAARNKVQITKPGNGIWEVGDEYYAGVFKGKQYSGVNILLPPRHGKTDMIVFDICLSIDMDHRIQMAVVHDKASMASERVLQPAKKVLGDETAPGRRNRRLFPETRLASYDNNEGRLRVVCDSPPANPNLIAGGVWTSAQGNNLDRVYGDDLVPQSDLTEAGTRERRRTAFSGTWLSRFQGRDGQFVLSGYPRHHEDLTWSYYADGLEYETTNGKTGTPMLTIRRPVGGPKSPVKFFSIWPEMYDSGWLRRKFNEYNDRVLWAANYELEPVPEDLQIVKKVRLYNPEDPVIIKALESAVFSLSVDPAAKGDGSGDKAGVIILALCDLVFDTEVDEGVFSRASETVALVVYEDEFHATQSELTEHMVMIASKWDIDTAHIERVTGLGSAMAEALEQHYGVNRVILHGTQNKGKASRLRAVAPMLEDSNRSVRAKVMFPGVQDEETSVMSVDPEYVRIVRYVTNFHVESGFHSLDALIQCVKSMVETGDLTPHQGQFSSQVRDHLFAKRNNRAEMIERAVGSMKRNQQSDEYAGFFGSVNNFV